MSDNDSVELDDKIRTADHILAYAWLYNAVVSAFPPFISRALQAFLPVNTVYNLALASFALASIHLFPRPKHRILLRRD